MDSASHPVLARPRATCPECGDSEIGRSHRRGWIERVISWFGLYPHRCVACNHRFFATLRD